MSLAACALPCALMVDAEAELLARYVERVVFVALRAEYWNGSWEQSLDTGRTPVRDTFCAREWSDGLWLVSLLTNEWLFTTAQKRPQGPFPLAHAICVPLTSKRTRLLLCPLGPVTLDSYQLALRYLAADYPETAGQIAEVMGTTVPAPSSGDRLALAKLIPWHREAVKLWGEGYREGEIGDKLGQPPKSVHKRISELRKRLGLEIVPHHGGPGFRAESGPIPGRSGP